MIWSKIRSVVEIVKNSSKRQLETEAVDVNYHLVYPPAVIMIGSSLLLIPLDGGKSSFITILRSLFLAGSSLLVTEVSRIAYVNWSVVVRDGSENQKINSLFIYLYLFFTGLSSISETSYSIILGTVVLVTLYLVVVTRVMVSSLKEYEETSPPDGSWDKITYYTGKYYLTFLLTLDSIPMLFIVVLVVFGVIEPTPLGLSLVIILSLIVIIMTIGYWVNEKS